MFTGIVQEIGKLLSKESFGKGFRMRVAAKDILLDLKNGDSISVNGVCQTVTSFDSSSFTFDTVEETVKKTNLGQLRTGDTVHLEPALMPQSRMGGHFVLGHVDATGVIRSISTEEGNSILRVSFPSGFAMYLTHVGSIAIDGVSLTIAHLGESEFSVAIIPHTWKHTIFPGKKVGDSVNLEFDILGKYVHRIVTLQGSSGKISDTWLKDLGY